ncbi:MAG: lysylphosphatidylglycerol synthetase family protein [Sphingobacteriales bacterium]|nr:lysylphosphatidylglycerol synthetase family protein [Sphingobacteriales bacterium]
MIARLFTHPIFSFFKEKTFPFIRENGKIIIQFIITILFIGIGIWFFKHQRKELIEVQKLIVDADTNWFLIGLLVTAIYILLQGLMYVASFSAVSSKISIKDATILFLKRNFISVFLPAGGVSSLAFFTAPLRKKGIKESQIQFASSIYGFVGILSVVIVAIPVFIYAFFDSNLGIGTWLALFSIILLLGLVLWIYHSIQQKGIFHDWLIKFLPSSEVFMEDIRSHKIHQGQLMLTIFYSIGVEIAGVAHIYIAMLALHLYPSLYAALIAYVISVIFLIISPFLRGLGAIEVSMSYLLTQFGFSNLEAISITFLYRFFEFWLPLVAGLMSFLLEINKLLMRILPALLLFILGVINIISVLTPAIAERLATIKSFLPLQAIQDSNYLVMSAGLFALVTAAFLLKGMRNAWWFALLLGVISFIGNLTKAIDFEEASVALLVIIILILTHKEYYVKSNPRFRVVGLQTSLLSIGAVIIYGVVGFYFLDKKYFNIDFSLVQSIKYTFLNYFLMGSDDLVTTHTFAQHFLLSIKISGFLSLGFLIFTLVKPFISDISNTDEEKETAQELLHRYGDSALDYFKTYFDKQLFISSNKQAFIAYRLSGNFAVALANPVAANEHEFKKCIQEFDRYCFENGVKSLYYRVPENDLSIYQSLGKKSLFLGQEAVVDISTFSLEGGSRKSLRNGLKKVSEKGLKASIHTPPIKDGLLQKIKSVSDEWLIETDRKEIIFSQGMFLWDELKRQTIITVENAEERVIAFLNIIPDYKKGEATYDLIRKTKDAPGGIMDFILVELFKYLKEQGYQYCNLGLAPMSGIDDPTTFTAKSMKFAYEKIKSFAHYRGLREFKDKYSPEWKNEYLIYAHDFDLLQAPSVLSNVIKP